MKKKTLLKYHLPQAVSGIETMDLDNSERQEPVEGGDDY